MRERIVGVRHRFGVIAASQPFVWMLLCGGPAHGQAGASDPNQTSTNAAPVASVSVPADSLLEQPFGIGRVNAYATFSYVFPGNASYSTAPEKRSDAELVNLGASANIPVNDRWFVPVGIGSADYFLEPATAMPIPEHIDTLRLFAGLGYRLNDQWSFAAGAGPELYRFDDIHGDDIGEFGMVRAVWRVRPGLTVAFGLGFNPNSDLPVAPAAGLRWAIETNLILNLMFPETGLIYRPVPRLDLFAGADFKFAVFRTQDDFGGKVGQSDYNNALGTYRDFHLGVGAEYRIVRGLRAGVEAGYSVGREIDYKNIGQTVRFAPSPYVQASLRFRF